MSADTAVLDQVEETAIAAELQLPPPYEDEFLETIVGEWEGEYTLAGLKFVSDAEVKWVYNHQFLQGRNRLVGPIGICESEETWQPTKEKGIYKLWWFDAWGNAGVADGRSTETGFVIHGGDPLIGTYRNTVIRKDDELLFNLESGPDENGDYKPLGGGFYRRVKKKA